jgi:hypothetical protein
MVRYTGILSGSIKDISEGGTADLVVFDDLVYSKPVKL